MAYNSGFPVNYPYLQQYQAPQQQNGVIWIQGGIAGASAYQVAPGCTVVLFDSDEQVIYLKSADASGRPSMRILDYTIRTEATRTAQNALSGQNTDVPTRRDLEALQGQIDVLKKQLEKIGGTQNEPAVRADAE